MKSREMTVYRARGNGKDLTVPMIMMQGKWLRDMGFAVGDRVSVTLQDGKLVVESNETRNLYAEDVEDLRKGYAAAQAGLLELLRKFASL